MNTAGTGPRPPAERRIIVVGLSLVMLVLCVAVCADLFRLVRLGLPWQAGQAAPVPDLPSTPTVAAPEIAATALPTATPEIDPLLPTLTLPTSPPNRMPPGQICANDRVQVEVVEPQPGATVEIDSGLLSVQVSFCLNSAPWADLLIALVPSESQPQTLPLGAPVVVQLGDGRYTQLLDWAAAPWSADLAGGYRVAATLNAQDDGRLLASSFGGQYFFVAP